VVAVVHHAGDARLLLAGRPDGADPDLRLAAVARAQRVEHGRDLLAPEVAGRIEAHLAVAHHEHDRLARASGDEQRVVAGSAQLARDAAARVRVGPGPGERRLADDLDASRERRAGAGQETGHDREAGLGGERVGARRKVLPHQVRAEPVAAEKAPVDRLVDCLDARRPGAQIHDQHATVRAEA